jgi:hypothetical protein
MKFNYNVCVPNVPNIVKIILHIITYNMYYSKLSAYINYTLHIWYLTYMLPYFRISVKQNGVQFD